MHILAVSHAYPRRSNSSNGIFIHRLHRGLRELGARVDVLQLAEWAPPRLVSELIRPWRAARKERDDLFDELDGITVHHPLVVTPRPSRFFPEDPWVRQGRAVVKYCMQHPALAAADVVLGHFLVPDGVYALRLGRSLGLPVAAVAWGDDVHAWPARSDEWRQRLTEVLEGIDLPLACSRRLVDDASGWMAQRRPDWQVVYGGIDLEGFTPSTDVQALRRRIFGSLNGALGDDALILLMVGLAVPEKGYIELLDAWSAIAGMIPQWHLVMAGGTGTLDVPQLAGTRGIASRAHWIGLQPVERMPDLMRASNAFVLPSHNEGLSFSVLEALATGLPTIATDVGGHAEVIRSPDEGWLVPPRDQQALGQALVELTTQPAERARRSAGARRAARRIGSPRENAGRLLSLLDTLAAKGPRRCAGAAQ